MEPILASKLFEGLAPASFFEPDAEITAITTDSREAKPGCVFLAFPGQNFDGNRFGAQAIAAGAEYVVLNHPVDGVPAEKTIICPESYRAADIMGANYRAQFSPLVVGVTGSSGKTTTKQMCFALLSAFGTAIKTRVNQNNELGVMRTLLQLGTSTQYAVVEMGMNHPGEISRMTRSVRPSAGIITNVGTAHEGNFTDGRAGICKAKLEICEGLCEGAPLVLNYDNDMLRAAKLPAHVKPVWFSIADEGADVCALSIQQEADGMSFIIEDHEHGTFMARIPVLGRHHVANALAAYCAVTRLGLDARRAAKALADFEQSDGRGAPKDVKGVTVFDCSYNANPDSMKAELETLKNHECKRRFALLGDMLELGSGSRAAHEELGRIAAESGLYCLVTYGEQAMRTAIVAAAKGQKTLHASSYREAADALLSRIQPGDALLVMGSHGMALENVLNIFYDEFSPEQ